MADDDRMNARTDPEGGIDPAVAEWLHMRLGSAPREAFFRATSMSDVLGIELEDGRCVAVKSRGADDRVLACARAQAAAADAGIDCPRLLAGPDRVGAEQAPAGLVAGAAGVLGVDAAGREAFLTVEEWREEGDPAPHGDEAVLYAGLLARLVTALEPLAADRAVAVALTPPPWLHYDHGQAADHGGAGVSRVWPPPASDRWDPHRIHADLPPELIDFARRARSRLLASDLPDVIGHTDLNGLNVRWVNAGGEPRPIVHDWDSIAARPEAVLVGTLAADHVALPDQGRIADVVTGHRVIRAYEEARRRTLSPEEREIAWATSAWLAAYNAAFEHMHGAPGLVTAQLLRDGEDRLALARA